jgi:hypothetical protein
MRSPNAYFIFRNDEINLELKRRMSDHSKITASKWNGESESNKRKYYQIAEKEAVEREAASGKKGRTEKSFEQYGDIAFVNEFPKKKTKSRRNARNKKESEVDKLFEVYTMNDDYIR